MNYWDDVGFAYQRPPGLINAPIRRDTRRKQLAEEQARRTYQGLLERDLIGIQQFSPFFGLNTRNPDAIPIAPMDVVPAGAGAKALGLLSTIPVGMIGQVAYHGGRKWLPEAGRPLGRPRLEHMSEGEGSQVYGHGFYVAENPEVSRGYFRALDRNRDVYHNDLNVGGMQVVKDGVPVDYSPPRRPKGTSEVVHNADQARAVLTEDLLIHEWKINEAFLQGGESGAQKAILDIVDERLRAAADEWPEIVPHLQRVRSKVLRDGIKIDPEVSTANFYKMDVPDDDVAKMLDHDAPLNEQPQIVKEVVRDVLKELKYLRPNDNGPRQLNSAWKAARLRYAAMNDGDSGAAIYRMISTHKGFSPQRLADNPSQPGNPAKAASEYLASKGIPGLKYLDQGSRTAGVGTRNMVIWDEDLLKRIQVLERE